MARAGRRREGIEGGTPLPCLPGQPRQKSQWGAQSPPATAGDNDDGAASLSHGPVGAGGIHPGRPAVLRLGIAEYIKGSTLIFWGLPQQGMLPKLLR